METDNILSLSEKERQLLGYACALDFKAFIATCLPDMFPYPFSPFHDHLCDVIQNRLGTKLRYAIAAPRGFGKAQPLDRKVLTEDGWKCIGDLRNGDCVVGFDGKNKKIRSKTDVKNLPIYRIVTETGRETEACREHWWFYVIGDGLGPLLSSTETLFYTLESGIDVYIPIYKDRPEKIKSIKFVGYKEAQCIEVEDGFYVTDDFIVTHNSTIVTEASVLWLACRKEYIKFKPRDPREKNYIIVVSDTIDQAVEHLSNVKDNLVNNDVIRYLFPNVSGPGSVWKSDLITTPGGAVVRAIGTTSKIRGRRVGFTRPDMILCHKYGTLIKDGDKWIPVEYHPTARIVWSDGYRIKVFGLPFAETVTKDHRYWARRVKFKKNSNDTFKLYDPEWIEAHALDNRTYIGYKIDLEVRDPEPIKIYKSKIAIRDNLGRIVKPKAYFIDFVPEEFYDRDFWWLVGYWWGNGYADGKNTIRFSLNRDYNLTLRKLQHIIRKFGRSPITYYNKENKTVTVTVGWSWLSRWLRAWRIGKSMKIPPAWVEKLDPKLQKYLVRGYLEADGYFDLRKNQIRLSSICLPGLLALRRILMRLGVPVTIRQGRRGGRWKIGKNESEARNLYDLRIREGAENLGYFIPAQTRYSLPKVFIKDGYLWSKVRKKEYVEKDRFVPIKTESGVYTTHFGLSHNCDDLENLEMVQSESMRNYLYEWFTRDVLKAIDPERADVLIVGTILSKQALLYRILHSEEFSAWDGKIFKAIISWPKRMDLWDRLGEIIKDRRDPERFEKAKRFYEEHKEEMDEGVEVLWPQRFSLYDLMLEYYLEGERAFLLERQNEVRESVDKVFELDKYYYYDEDEFEDIPPSRLLYFMYVDPATGKKKGRTRKTSTDMFACVVIAKDVATNVYYVVDYFADIVPPNKQFQIIKRFIEIYPIYRFFVESNTSQFYYYESLKDWLQTQGIYRPVPRPHINKENKERRIEALAPYLENWTLRLSANHRQLLRDLEDYPSVEYDDLLDCLSACFFNAYKKGRLIIA